jgi:hypothetical protein
MYWLKNWKPTKEYGSDKGAPQVVRSMIQDCLQIAEFTWHEVRSSGMDEQLLHNVLSKLCLYYYIPQWEHYASNGSDHLQTVGIHE